MVRFMVIGLTGALLAAAAAMGLNRFSEDQQAAAAPQPAAMVATPASPPPAPTDGYGEASIAKSPDGHFWADATVNGRQVHFLIDTGATAVALTAADARNLGIDPSTLTYSYTVQTANGPAHAAPVKLSMISVGRAEVPDVDAFVIDSGLETSLLGMTYLGRLAKFEATQDALVLKS
jgi:aspartyl protease family protein